MSPTGILMILFDDQLTALIDSFGRIQNYQRTIDKNTSKLVAELAETKKQLELLDPDSKDVFGNSVDAFYFYNPYTGLATAYHAKKTSIDEAIELTYLHKNKQYQWLLAEAYEAYEDYLENMYACVGYSDPRLWPDKDLASLSPSKTQSLGLDWFFEKSRNKRGGAGAILCHFRRILPNLKTIERVNHIGVDLRLSISIVEKIRHIVVHRNGKIESRGKLVDAILKSSNLLNNKALEPPARARIDDHIGTREIDGLIILVERPIFQSGGFSMRVNRHENLVGELLGHAHVLRHELSQLFAKSDT
jgi:hypothetical protein